MVNTQQDWEQKPKVFLSPAPAPNSFNFSHFLGSLSVGDGGEKWNFALIAAEPP